MKLFSVLLACLMLASCGKDQEPATPAPQPTDTPASTPESAPPTKLDDRPKIVAFGDSLTAGYGAEAGKSYPDFLQTDLDQLGYRYQVINCGVSGDTTSGGLARVDQVLSFHPEFVVLELGGNDGLRGLPPSATRKNLDDIIASLEKGGAKVTLAGITLPRNYGPEYIASFEQNYSELAKKYRIPLLPFLLQDVYGLPGMIQNDGIHPTAQGNAIVAKNVLRVLQPQLKKR